jgi:hypothetical protein
MKTLVGLKITMTRMDSMMPQTKGSHMKIDWKKVSKSDGYKSLKKAYIRDVQNSAHLLRKGLRGRSKEEFRRHFKRAIGLAMHFSHKWQLPLETVLDHWESKRDYWWLNFYQRGCVSRLKPNL